MDNGHTSSQRHVCCPTCRKPSACQAQPLQGAYSGYACAKVATYLPWLTDEAGFFAGSVHWCVVSNGEYLFLASPRIDGFLVKRGGVNVNSKLCQIPSVASSTPF